MGARSPVLDGLGDDVAWSLLDAAPDGVFVVADDGNILFASAQAAVLFGCPVDDLLGRSVDDLLPDDLRAGHAGHRNSYRQHPGVRAMGAGLELLARRADGTAFPAEISLSPLPIGDTTFVVAAVRDITDRVAAEEAHRRDQDALRNAEQIVALAEDRDRIARDLHDTVIQRLFGAGLHLQAALAMPPDRSAERIESTIDELDDTIRELRTTIFSLQGSATTPSGLRGRLLDVVSDAGSAMGFDPRLQLDGHIESLDRELVEHLIPTLREALSNVAHHAQARHVRVRISAGDHLTLTVTDDGVGIDGEVFGGHGLTNMASRAEQLRGSFALRPATGGGCELEWRVPVARRDLPIG